MRFKVLPPPRTLLFLSPSFLTHPQTCAQELSEKEIAPFVEMEHKRSMKKEDGEGKFHAPSGVGAGGLNEGRARREELYQLFHGFSI